MVELEFDYKAKAISNRIDAGEDPFEVAKAFGMYRHNVLRIYREYNDDMLKLCAKHADNNKQLHTIYNGLRRHNIHTIDDLRITPLEDISNFYGMGKTYMRVIAKMKEDIGGAKHDQT